jgi:hypothetical protein
MRLDFDFHARPSRPNRLGVALALAGIVAMGWAWTNLQAARASEAGVALQIAALEQVRPQPVAQSLNHADDATQAARARIAAQLAYSWQPAFDALAAARSGKIALVSFDAVQAKSQLKLVAEVRHLADAIAFVEGLQQQAGVKRAELTQHETQTDSDSLPVRVNIRVELDR